MIFSKGFFRVFTLFIFSFFLLYHSGSWINLGSNFSFSFEEKIISFFLGVVIDKNSLIFFTIMCLVTRLVFLYSEVYIERYKNKKFFLLTLFFFSFIVILSYRRSLINVIIGWDGLGISSLLLIMFYPNKITFFNSFMTFFFNRIGDIFFLSFFCLFMLNYRLFFYLNIYTISYIFFFFFLCLLTKRAQIPFSS